MRDKSRIDGAYLLIKRYKNRLKNYDIALERIDQKKCEKSDFEALSKSVDQQRAFSIFNDMKLLFDTTL